MVEGMDPRMTVALRPASVEDVGAVLDFWAIAAEDANRPPDDDEALARLIDRDREALVLAIDGGRIAGSLIAGWDGWRFHLYRLAVHPARRRQGIADLLLDRAEERFAAFGARRADAMVLDDNSAAHAFWATRGYRAQPEWSRWVKSIDL